MKFYRCTYVHGDDLVYGLKVKARAGVICLIQPLTETDTAGNPYMPYRPDESDSTIFAYSRLLPTAIEGPLKVEEAGHGILLYQKKSVPL